MLFNKNSSKNSTDILLTMKADLEEHGHVYIDGPTMILLLKEHGATDDDLGMLS